MTLQIDEMTAAHLGPVLDLNNRHRVETSLLDLPSLEDLAKGAFVAAVAPDGSGGVAAFLIAFDQAADYDSANFLWFKSRYDRFCYVDRIVVDPAARGQGLARALYDRLFERAHGAGHAVVGCEVNTRPANPGSRAFHTRMGFRPVGTAELPERGKAVEYLVKDLVSPA